MKPFNKIPNAIEVGHDGGAFRFNSPIDKAPLVVIASFGMGWDHISVSRKNRCPNWPEMCFIKDIFFEDDEVVIQYHPKKSEYVNDNKNCLHLWKPHNIELPMPDVIMV